VTVKRFAFPAESSRRYFIGGSDARIIMGDNEGALIRLWREKQAARTPRLFGVEPPRPRIEAVRIVDMSASNAWAEFAGIFVRTRDAHLEHERAKAELKSLMPEDAQQAIGHGIRAKRSKSGAVSFDLLKPEGEGHAAVQ